MIARAPITAAAVLGAGVFIVLAAAALGQGGFQQPCSVFDGRPCTPSFCSVFDEGPCLQDFGAPIGQDLRLTIDTKTAPPQRPDGELNTIAALFQSLRACWVPPEEDKARIGLEVSVRLSFKKNGEVIAPPRWTYTTPKTPDGVRQIYRDAVTAALARCTPLHFTKGMAGAIAGRPIAIRYVENRELKQSEARP
jgi:hypothetical protein